MTGASSLVAGTLVRSDGLACLAAVTDAGCVHTVEVVGQRKPRDLPQFKWVNSVLEQPQDDDLRCLQGLQVRQAR